jgi:serine/threonine protein kinase
MIIRGYIIGPRIGKGTYGQVHSGISPDGTSVAMKKICITPNTDSVFLLYRELTMLRAVGDHPNVVSISDVVADAEHGAFVYLVTPLYDCDLRSYVKANFKGYIAPHEVVQDVMGQLVAGLAYMHSMHVLHRDIKPQNILVRSVGGLRDNNAAHRLDVVLSDLGLAKLVNKRLPRFGYDIANTCSAMTHEIVTLWYRAPEVILGATTYTGAIDVWSLGVVLIELCTGRCPFNGRSEVDTLMKIFQLSGTPKQDGLFGKMRYFSSQFPKWEQAEIGTRVRQLFNDKYTEIAAGMIAVEPGDRITTAELKKVW